jgi:hypothetical protein
MKTVTASDRRVQNYKSAPSKDFKDADGRGIPGQTDLQLDDSFPDCAGFTLYRMAPGTSSQPHEHTCV